MSEEARARNCLPVTKTASSATKTATCSGTWQLLQERGKLDYLWYQACDNYWSKHGDIK